LQVVTLKKPQNRQFGIFQDDDQYHVLTNYHLATQDVLENRHELAQKYAFKLTSNLRIISSRLIEF